jgi:gluconokinase
MALSTRSSTNNPSGVFIVSLDVGSSSVRALLFDGEARQMEGYGAQVPYQLKTTADGGAEIDPAALAELTIDCLDELHRQVHAAGLPIAAVAASAFWHSFLGVGDDGRPTLPILHLLDTRSAAEVAHVPDRHNVTGCVPHSSYWPAKLLWLARARPAEFAATRRWLSFPEFLFEKLFGRAHAPTSGAPTSGASTSMVSASGLWDQNANDYDAETLRAVNLDRSQLADPNALDRPLCELLPQYLEMWPSFDRTPWFPALGDGACSNLGSGCVSADRLALMVGTTGAMRAIIEAGRLEIAPGLWCYRVDRKRFITGGALSNGGDVFAWMKRTLALPRDLEARLEKAAPGGHGLTLLPFLSGERSPYWRADLRGVIAGLTQSTEPLDILRASLESVALRFREIHGMLAARLGMPAEIIATGGALLNSPAWTQMMADAIGRPLIACTEPEASCRGAAVWALEQIGAITSIGAVPASLGVTFDPRVEYSGAYDRLLVDQQILFKKIYEP